MPSCCGEPVWASASHALDGAAAVGPVHQVEEVPLLSSGAGDEMHVGGVAVPYRVERRAGDDGAVDDGRERQAEAALALHRHCRVLLRGEEALDFDLEQDIGA